VGINLSHLAEISFGANKTSSFNRNFIWCK